MQQNQKQPELTAVSVEPHSDRESEFSKWGKELEQLAQAGVKKEIAFHKAHGRPIFYSRDGVPIMELADGHCFEYRRLEDGTREIIREVPQG
jgi:hypothetical protein